MNTSKTHCDVSPMLEACQSLWHKTRQRADRKKVGRIGVADIMEIFGEMCGYPTPILFKGVPDWPLIVSTCITMKAMIRHSPDSYLDALLYRLFPAASPMGQQVETLRRRLGRDPRVSQFLLKAQAFYKSWALEPDWDIDLCPFPVKIGTEAAAIKKMLTTELIAWSKPRREAIQEAMRDYIRDNPPDADSPYVTGEIRVNPNFRMTRKTPPIHTFLPKIACMQIHRALAGYQKVRFGRPRASHDKQMNHLTRAGDTISKILERYLPIFRQVRVTSAEVWTDIMNYDRHASAEDLLGLPIPARKRRVPKKRETRNQKLPSQGA